MMRAYSKEELEMSRKIRPYLDFLADEYKVKDDSPEEIKKLAEEFKIRFIDNNPIPEGWG